MELTGILDKVSILPLFEAVRRLHGAKFHHPNAGELVFDHKSAWSNGENSVLQCFHWVLDNTAEDVRCAVSVDCLAALRSFTGTVMCYVLREHMTNRLSPRFADALPFAKP
eukprot:RCo023497